MQAGGLLRPGRLPIYFQAPGISEDPDGTRSLKRQCGQARRVTHVWDALSQLSLLGVPLELPPHALWVVMMTDRPDLSWGNRQCFGGLPPRALMSGMHGRHLE